MNARVELDRFPAGWSLSDDGKEIHRTFTFRDYHRVLAFVNAVAWIAHRQDHHPDLEVGYSRVTVRYTTHSAGGLTPKDVAAASAVDALGADEVAEDV